MQNFLRFLLFAGLLATPLLAQRDIGDINVVVENNTIPVRVTASPPELQTLAQVAFGAHGRYDVRGSRPPAYDIRFTQLSGTEVRVDVTRGGAVVSSDRASDANARQALLRAADLAVAKTNGLGLRGFFTAQLAFVGERSGTKEVYTSDLFMLDAKQLTRDRALVLTPRWSPDGGRLLFTSYKKSGAPDIFQYDVRSYQTTIFVSYKGTNSGARYSPNGQQVAMVLSGEGSPEIYVRNAAGGPVSRKTRSEFVKSSPVWSPDGSRLLFAMEPGPQLYTMSTAGGTPQRLQSGFNYSAEPDWSRTSNKIAFTVRVPGGRYQIAVMDAGGGRAKLVSEAAFDAIEPSWLADGRHLVYTARSRTSSVLCILDTETGRSTALSAKLGPAMQASVWTPQ